MVWELIFRISSIPSSPTGVRIYQLPRGISLKPSGQGPAAHQIQCLWQPRLTNLLPPTVLTLKSALFQPFSLVGFYGAFVSQFSYFSLSSLSPSFLHLSYTIAQVWAHTPAQPSDPCLPLSRVISETPCCPSHPPSAVAPGAIQPSPAGSGLWWFCPIASLQPRQLKLKVFKSQCSLCPLSLYPVWPSDAASIICVLCHPSPWESPFTPLFL